MLLQLETGPPGLAERLGGSRAGFGGACVRGCGGLICLCVDLGAFINFWGGYLTVLRRWGRFAKLGEH